MRALAVCLFLILGAIVAHAEDDPFRADQVIKNCKSPDGYRKGLCVGMVVAIAYVSRSMPTQIRSCYPDEVTNEQILNVVRKYVDERPNIHHRDFRLLALEAMKAAWPCKGK